MSVLPLSPLLSAALTVTMAAALGACSSVSDDGPQPPRFADAAYANGDTTAFIGEWTWIGTLTSPEAPAQRYLTTPTPGTVTAQRVLDGHRLQQQVDGEWLAPHPYRFVVIEPTVPGAQRRVVFDSPGLDPCGGTFALDARHFATLGTPCDGTDDYYRRR